MPATQAMTSHNINAANQKIKSQLDMKVQSFRMFKAVQQRMKETMDVQRAFHVLDTNQVGFLTLRDFQINLSKHFNLSLKAKEVR
jgi:transposase-like protein